MVTATATSERIGWRGSSSPGLMQYRYECFEGCESQTVSGNRGDVVSLDYRAEVDAGTVFLELLNEARQPVWQCCVFRDGGESAAVALPADGHYRFEVRGRRTRGAFHVRWNVEQAARV